MSFEDRKTLLESFRSGEIGSGPGIYIFRDSFGRIIYVGKAKNLRKRLSRYFRRSDREEEDPKIRSMINSIASFETKGVDSENEALVLESRLIKDYSPYYNILMRDDKRFLMMKINQKEALPRIELVRLRKNDGALYFGPFPKGTILKFLVEFLNRHFGLRSCKSPIPDEKDHRHCLRKTIEHCSAPCIGRISAEDYGKRISRLIEIANGDTEELICEIRTKMSDAASARNYELAAKLRDAVSGVEEIFSKKARSFERSSIGTEIGSEGARELGELLGLSSTPRRIEAFDISNISGLFAVGSMVSFYDGRPDRKNYRRFKIKTVAQSDDFAMMREMISRRYRRALEEGQSLPDLILVDGGKGQLSSAISAMASVNLPPVPVIGLAKRREEIFVPGRSDPLDTDRDGAASKLLQAVRDEAHRFAISYHRTLRDKRISESILDEIAGVGKERKIRILRAFGSIGGIKKASVEEIVSLVPGLGTGTAAEILKKLGADPRI